ncbi:MAG: hypothetical protein GXO40_04750 [Epsilonproteobacteria bacterium]|nr:hypothetical protein [Campylobacterota bacterium]
MRLVYLLWCVTWVFGYYAKVEPYEIYNIKSDVNGIVLDVNKSAENTSYKGVVITIDSYDDKVNLHNLQTQLHNYQNILHSNEAILQRKQQVYHIYQHLKTKSRSQKDAKFYEYQNALIALNQTKNTISNLKAKILSLQNTIAKKTISFHNYIYKINVNKGDYVTVATPIATTMDITKSKLNIFVPIDKVQTIIHKHIYINSKLSDYHITKIYKVADDKYVTSYKVELVGSYHPISDVVKVEFK